MSEFLEDIRHLQALRAGEPSPMVEHVATKRIWTAKAIYSSFLNQVLRLQPTFRLPFRITVFLMFMVILSAVCGVGLFYVRIQTGKMLVGLKEKGAVLARNVASASEVSLLTGDQMTLYSIIAGLVKESDVAYCIILNNEGEPLASTPMLPRHIKGIYPAADYEVNERALRADKLKIQHFTEDERKTPVYDIAAPVMTQTTTPLSREEVILGTVEKPERIGLVRIGISTDDVNEEIRQMQHTTMTVAATVILLLSGMLVLLAWLRPSSVRK